MGIGGLVATVGIMGVTAVALASVGIGVDGAEVDCFRLRFGLPRFGLSLKLIFDRRCFCFLGLLIVLRSLLLLEFRLGHRALLERRLDPAFIMQIYLHSYMQT